MVGDAVIVAGGIGSRMLPASAMVAKEALPLIDVPILNHLCWEAIRAGANRLHLVISERKAGLEMKLMPNEAELRALQESRPDLPERAFKAIPDGVEIITHFQYVPLGMADAVLQALRSFDGPALVLLGDNLLMDSHPSVKNVGIENASTASLRLVEAFSRTGRPVAGLWSVSESEVGKYGVVAQDGERIVEIMEKPDEGLAPSRKVLCGRYLFSADARGLLENECSVEKFGELQSIALFHHWMKHDGGFIGVDLVLGEKAGDDRVIEINPRPTTSYCALRRRSSVNLARLSLDLLDHREPELPEWPPEPELFDSEGNAGEWPGGRVSTAADMERVS